MVNKEDFVVGRWYAHYPYNDLNQLWYIKFKCFEKENVIKASEYISNSKRYYKSEGNFGTNIKEFWDINISEIVHLLSKNHLDLINSSYLIDNLEIW